MIYDKPENIDNLYSICNLEKWHGYQLVSNDLLAKYVLSILNENGISLYNDV